MKPKIIKKTKLEHYHYEIECPICEGVFGTGDENMIFCSNKCKEKGSD